MRGERRGRGKRDILVTTAMHKLTVCATQEQVKFYYSTHKIHDYGFRKLYPTDKRLRICNLEKENGYVNSCRN